LQIWWALAIWLVWAGSGGRPDEEWRNLSRRALFAEQRGLAERPDAGRIRARAIQSLRNRSARVSEPEWVSMGPDTANMFSWRMGRVAGRVSAIAVDPTDRQTIFLGTGSGGLWKTTDGGQHWQPLFDEIGTLSIGSLMQDPEDPQTLYVGTGDHTQGCAGYFGLGLFRTRDGGASFEALNGSSGQLLELSHIAAIAETAGGVLLTGGHAWCDDGATRAGALFRSTDDGATWQRVLSGAVGDIVPHPTDPDLVFAAVGRFGATENGIYRSTDGGQTWARLTNGLPFGLTIGRTRVAMAPSDPMILYALLNGVNGRTDLYRSTDGGNTWQQRQNAICTEQCWYNLTLSIDPTDPARLLVGAILLHLSDDGGFSFQPLIQPWGDTQQVHQDVHAIAFDPTDPQRFWIGTDGGLWRTSNGGGFYQNLNANLSITQLFDIALDPTDPTRVFAGAMDNSSMRTNGQAVWDVTFANGDGTNNAVDPRDPDTVYQAGTPDAMTGPRLIRSSNGGGPGSFTLLPMTGVDTSEPWSFKLPLATAAGPLNAPRHVFIGAQRVYRSSDRGSTWQPLSPASLGGGTLEVLMPFVRGGRLQMLAGTLNGRLFHCDDTLAADPSWTDLTGNYPGGAITGIALLPDESVLVSRGGFGFSRLYRAPLGEDQWAPIGTGLPEVPANEVVLDPLDGQRVFVATDIGVFESNDAGQNFAPLLAGMPLGSVVTDLEVSADPHLLVAGTYGRGVWQITLAELSVQVDAGLDRSICSGDALRLTATPANAEAPLTWSWGIVSGPDTAETQFDDASLAEPEFSPNEPGTYELRVIVTDADDDSAEDQLIVTVGDRVAFEQTQRAAWLTQNPDLDRDNNDQIDIRDMVIQQQAPICP